jgi:hypothetical protein
LYADRGRFCADRISDLRKEKELQKMAARGRKPSPIWDFFERKSVTVLRSRRAICSLAIDSSDEDFKAIANRSDFWTACRLIDPILRECGLAILKVEADGACIEKAFAAMLSIGQAIEKATHPEKSEILRLFRYRAKFLYSGAMVLASALNPISPVCPAARRIVCNYLQQKYGGALGSALAHEFEDFQTRSGRYGSPLLWGKEATESALKWWRGMKSGHLRFLALGLFATPASSASVERSFKQIGNMQTKTRNRMKNETARQLVAAKAYLRALAGKKEGSKFTLVPAEEPEKHQFQSSEDCEDELAEEDEYEMLEDVLINGDEFFDETDPEDQHMDLDRDVTAFAEFTVTNSQQENTEVEAADEDAKEIWG